MLIELSSDSFRSNGEIREKIIFHQGLNTIVGGDRGVNSIGKSTFLMLLDFVFAGEDYISKNIKDINEVGPHNVNFAFQTEYGKKYFSRSTKNPYKVNVCNEEYSVLKTISIDKYRSELLKIYKISIPNTTFRDIVSSFIRVHPRIPSKLITTPLKAAASQPVDDQIIKFEKMFNSYKEISALKDRYDELDLQLKTIVSASKYNYIKAASNITAVRNNNNRIENLEFSVEELKREGKKDLLTIKAVKNDSIKELIIQINSLKDQRSELKSRIYAIQRNQDFSVKVKKQNYEQLQKYFPDLNVGYLNQVEQFHSNLVKILKKEFKDSIKMIQDQIDIINHAILGLENKVKEVNEAPNINMALIEKISRYENEIQNLKKSNDFYEQRKILRDDKKKSKFNWDEAVKKGLEVSQENINQAMRKMNIRVCGNNKVYPPVLKIIDGKHYEFSTSADTGTGSEYKGAILFDLACLQLSELPFLIHDSLMFSNIEIDRVQNIIKLYSEQTKQVFISIDKINELDEDVQQIIKSHQVLKLDRGGNELFGRTWGVESTKEEV